MMMQYIVILLDDTSVSFCHYDNPRRSCHLMPIEILKAGILYAMKQNLSIQFVYPKYEIPVEYQNVINDVDHINIKHACSDVNADIVVLDDISQTIGFSFSKGITYVLRINKKEFFAHITDICSILNNVERLNIVLTDIESFVKKDFEQYSNALETLSEEIEKIYVSGGTVQFNLLTDRMMLDKMNNCGAGDTSITLAPDGKFYVCPAFYVLGEENVMENPCLAVGDLQKGLDIKNSQLYKLDHAPLCRNCDAFQCKRCIWQNKKMTYEVNTPSHEQCVIAHIERNTSRKLLNAIRKHGTFLPEFGVIKDITYLDPFDVRTEWE